MSTEQSLRKYDSLEEFAGALTGESVAEIIEALWKFNPSGYSFASAGTDKELFDSVLNKELDRTRLLLTENSRLHTPALLTLGRNLGQIIQDILDRREIRLRHVASVRDLLTAYRRTPANFAPLKNDVRKAQNGWGSFLGCIAEGQQEVFAMAAGHLEKVLIHFDQWIDDLEGKRGAELSDRFAEQLDHLLTGHIKDRADLTTILVKKEYGPHGPEVLWPSIRTRIGLPITDATYDQSAKALHTLNSVSIGDNKYLVILYDLIKTGDGLREIDNYFVNLGYSRENIYHIILYDYRRQEDRQADISTGRLKNVFAVYDFVKHDALSPDNLFNLFSKSRRVSFGEERISADPFERVKLRDVDFIGSKLGSHDGDARLARNLEALIPEHAGNWVAISCGKIIDKRDTYAKLTRSLEQSFPNHIAAITYVPREGEPVDYDD